MTTFVFRDEFASRETGREPFGIGGTQSWRVLLLISIVEELK